MKKKFLAMALGIAVVLSCTACGGGSSDTAAPASGETNAASSEAGSDSAAGGSTTVTVAIGAGFSTLDPGYVYEKYPPLVINACYENLFKFYSNDGAAEPCLADSYEFSDDNKTLTVKLKENVTFASGNKMTSADVAFSINRCKNLQGNPSFICDTIDSIETPDDYTVVFHLTQPDSAILSKLTYSSLAVLDSAVVKEHGGTDAADASSTDTAQAYLDTASAGSGMYIMTSYTPDSEIVLEKNPNYWGEPTNVDKYVIKIQPDANTQMMTLSSGDLDIAMNMTDDTMSELTGDNVAKINTATKTVGFLLMNMNEEYGGPVSNPKVQQAIRKALDYTGIQTIVGEGADMEGVLLTDLAQKVKDDLSQIGINVNIVSQPWAAGFGDDYRDGKIGFTVMYWSTDYNDPNVQLEFLPGQSVGLRAGWTTDMDPDLAQLYADALDATDNDARIAVLEKIQDDTYENGPWLMIAQAPAHIAYNTRLDGVAASDPYSLDLTQITIK